MAKSKAAKPAARKAEAKKPLAKKPLAAKKPAPKKPAAKAGKRAKWFDTKSHAPLINQYVERLDTFVSTMADGVVDDDELAAQEGRLIARMKEVEPLLDDALHEKVTILLCELCAYDVMQMLHTMQKAQAKTKFIG